MMRILMIILKNLPRIIAAYFRFNRYARHPDRYTREETWAYVMRLLNLVMGTANIELTVTGLQNIPQQDGFMLYGNHQGMFDVVAVGSTCPRPLGVVYKQELKNIPLLKQILTVTNSYALDRSDARQGITVMQSVTEQVQAGRNYVIFPEGTRSKIGNGMNEWHAGPFRCALKAKCPIVPMAFVDCFKVFDQKGCKKVAAQLHYLEPIPYEEYKHLKTPEIAELVKARVQAALDKYAE